MANTKLPPTPVGVPPGHSYWNDWYERLRNLVNNTLINHNDLQNIQGGSAAERYHLTNTQQLDLTDGGDSALHFHSADRARANHTGTQTLSTISDVTITAANLNSLDDGVDSSLHFHSSDRARANHTGTQTLSTISDVTITATNLNSLDDGVDSTLHFHASDRARANHTGTQDHNTTLSGLQGGTTGQYYHLTSAEYTGTGSGNFVRETSPTLITPKATTTIGVGNATPSASGSGISFPATQSASTDANTLDDYEEGTWTPGSAVGTATSVSGKYTKIGKVVFLTGTITFPVQTDAALAVMTGLPFTSDSSHPGSLSFRYSTQGNAHTGYIDGSATTAGFYSFTGAGLSYTNLSGVRLDFSGLYFI